MAQAVDALRHGWPIRIRQGDGEGAPLLLPIETSATPAAATSLLLISAARAVTLKLANQREAADLHSPVLIRVAEPLDMDNARPIADPALDLAVPLKGPFKAEHLDWRHSAEVALELARIAGILPAFMVDPEPAGEPVCLEAQDLAEWSATGALAIAARAELPLAINENSQIVAFRKPDDMREHVAIVIGEQMAGREPLVRMHSECLTGDIFGSLKCDCGPQLDAALAIMADEAKAGAGGWGVLLYMRQEGRGIGLINKLRAYRLQDAGFDTLEANARLGLPEEARDFPVAARMLELLGVPSVRLLTNNPAKVAALEAAGIEVSERVAHNLPPNPHNERYLATKRDRAGHLFE